MKKKLYAVACAVLAIDMKHSAEKLRYDIEFKFLEAGLHNNPKLLKEKLQAAIDEISASNLCERIIIGYGVCGKGTIGVQSRSIPLTIPKVHDCVALFLGGDAAYKREFKKYPGTYYLSAGLCEQTEASMAKRKQFTYCGDKKLEFSDLVEKHGKKAALQTFDFLNSWQKNYQRAVFIETGIKKSLKYEKLAKEMAGEYNWEYEKINGSSFLIDKMITADHSSSEILYVPPEHVIGFDAIQSTLSAGPVIDSESFKIQTHQLAGHKDVSAPDLKSEIDLKSKIDCKKKSASDYSSSTSVLLQSGLKEKPNQLHEPHDSYIKTGLGIDAGGTYTDAVIYDLEKNRTLFKSKSLTTKWDFTKGINSALKKLDAEKLLKVELVSLSTTLATNAIVENQGQKVGMILMPPLGLDIYKSIDHRPMAIIKGQLEINGRQIQNIDKNEVKQAAARMVKNNGVTAFAVSGYAGSVNPEHEIKVKKIIHDETGMSVSCGHELSDTLDFQTRAVTAMLNARIIPRLTCLLYDLEKVLKDKGINAPVVVVKGDGTLINSTMAKKRPVETILSGPAASVAGARHLTGIKDAIVVDMGGTTTDTAALSNNKVSLNEKGSNVGGHRTHVKALEIRTAGLGGDSLIEFKKGVFSIGPKRVAPMAWLGHIYPKAADAVNFLNQNMNRHTLTTEKMHILVKTGSAKKIELNSMEQKIISLLAQRPYSIDELVLKTNVLSSINLPLQRLEENFIVQRCGLTLTDILHITGRFVKWDRKTAEQYCEMFCFLSKKQLSELTQYLLDMGRDLLTMELLKRQLDDEVDPEAMNTCPVCRVLIDNLLAGGNPDYSVSINFKRPVIGIGAPVQYFLPRAVKPFGTRAVLPEDSDVANAIGAIVSKIVIKKQLRIIPGDQGGFSVEGVSGTHQFKEFEKADDFARKTLARMVKKMAQDSGTSSRKITFKTKDHIPKTVCGDPVFMERIIYAVLTGRPDKSL